MTATFWSYAIVFSAGVGATLYVQSKENPRTAYEGVPSVTVAPSSHRQPPRPPPRHATEENPYQFAVDKQ